MEDISEKLQQILSNPEALGVISEVASKIMQPDETEKTTELPDLGEFAEKIKSIPALGGIISEFGKNKKERISLLNSLKPFIDDSKKEKLDVIISFLRLCDFFDSAGFLM